MPADVTKSFLLFGNSTISIYAICNDFLGNEKADDLSKIATLKPVERIDMEIRPPLSIVTDGIKKTTRLEWLIRWWLSDIDKYNYYAMKIKHNITKCYRRRVGDLFMRARQLCHDLQFLKGDHQMWQISSKYL